MNRFTLSHHSVTCRRSPEVSSTAFDTQPPDLPPVSLMDMGFAIVCLLARHRRPLIRFLFIGSRLCSTLLSGPASRRVLFHLCASLTLPGRPGEFRPEPPTDPDVNLSIHPARATQRRLPPSVKTWSSSGYPLTPSRRGWPAPFAPRELPRFLATTKQCAPDRCIGTFGLVGSPLVPFSLSSPTRFSSSIREPGLESRLLYTGHRIIGK